MRYLSPILDGAGNVRQDERTQVDEPARLHPNGWSSLEVRVLDISPSGFRAECEARVLNHSPVMLEVPGMGPVPAHVAWRRGSRFGAKFDTPIDVARCSWTPVCDQVVLSRMLVDLAAARRRGAFSSELKLKEKILEALPMRPVAGAEPKQRRR
jgi:hypothetical protein